MIPIRATLEDYKRIKTRATWQIILEIDENAFQKALEALGSPTTGESISVAVVRLEEDILPPFLEKTT